MFTKVKFHEKEYVQKMFMADIYKDLFTKDVYETNALLK